jgi:hypothetical protein
MITCNYFCIVAIAVVTWCPRQTYDHAFTWMRKTFVVVRASTVFSTSSHVRSFATMCFLALVLGNYGIFSCRCPLWLQCSHKSSGFFAKFLLVETLEHFFFQFFETFFRSFFFNIKKRTRSSIRKAFETRTQQVSKKTPTQQTLEYSISKIRNGYYFEIHYLESKFQLLLQNIWGKVWSHLGIVFFVSGAVFHSFLFNFDHFLQICCQLILNLFLRCSLMILDFGSLNWSPTLNFGQMIFPWNAFAILQEIFKKKSPKI